MLVDRPAERASWPVRVLAWTAGAIGLGLGVMAVQQLLAEPAGADTPGLVDGVVGTVEEVVEPVSAGPVVATSTATGAPRAAPETVSAPSVEPPPVEPPPVESPAPAVESPAPVIESPLPAAPVVNAPASDPLAPVVEPSAPVVEPLAEAISPVVNAAAPVVNAAMPVVAPAVDAVTPVLKPVEEAVTPVISPVVKAVGPVVAPLAEAVPPVLAPVGHTVTPILSPAVEAVVRVVPGPLSDGLDLRPRDASDPVTAFAERPTSPTGPRASPLLVPGSWSVMGGDGDGPVPMRGSMGRASPGLGPAAGDVPPGPLALAVPSALSGGLGGLASGGGAGPSALLAVLAGGVLGLGLARGGVVHDSAARLIGLVHAPGRLPG